MHDVQFHIYKILENRQSIVIGSKLFVAERAGREREWKRKITKGIQKHLG